MSKKKPYMDLERPLSARTIISGSKNPHGRINKSVLEALGREHHTMPDDSTRDDGYLWEKRTAFERAKAEIAKHQK